MYFIQSYAFYFYLTWMPTYLERIRGFKATDLGLFAGAPMVACMVADLTGGLATDSITKRFGLRLGRTIAGGSGFIFAGLFTLLGASAADPTTAALYLALGAGWGAFCLGAAWGTCMDIAGPHAGVVGAVMNTAGQVGGFLSPIVLATLIRETGDWNTPLNITGVMLVGAALCWVFINPNRRIRLH
jgi:MFS family permease